ncbi:MAG: electron transport complex subunit RsxA, partial [candidate division WOR-3 bacterium]|nr:electron transport complex subunit RsxA [candidate division WOR-3 bacterium]
MGNNLLLIFIAAFIVNNILLMRYIGLCPFFGVSTSLTTAFGMSAAVLFVMLLATWVTWIIYHYLLFPLGLVFL